MRHALAQRSYHQHIYTRLRREKRSFVGNMLGIEKLEEIGTWIAVFDEDNQNCAVCPGNRVSIGRDPIERDRGQALWERTRQSHRLLGLKRDPASQQGGRPGLPDL